MRLSIQGAGTLLEVPVSSNGVVERRWISFIGGATSRSLVADSRVAFYGASRVCQETGDTGQASGEGLIGFCTRFCC